MSKPKVIYLPDDADAEWAKVELYRWQHGHLPGKSGTESQPFSVAEGLRGMAKAIWKGDQKNFPSPFNMVIVLNYVAHLIEKASQD